MNRLDIPLNTFLLNKINDYLSKGTEKVIEYGWTIEVEPRDLEERPKPSNRLFASQISKCGRYLWLERRLPNRLKENLPPETILIPNRRTIQFGHIFEGYILSLLVAGGANVYGSQDKIVNTTETISGRVDGIIKIDEKEYILEIKSLKHELIEDMVQNGVQKATPYYYDQVQVYLKYSRLPQCVFLSISRNTLQIFIEIIHYDKDRASYLVNKIDAILGAQKIQQIEEKYLNRECTWCSARDFCMKVDGEEKFKKLEKGEGFWAL